MTLYPPLKRLDIAVTTNGSGAATVTSDISIYGELMAIGYTKGTVNSSTTAAVATKNNPIEALDSYDVNGGTAKRYPRAAVTGASAGDNKWCPFVIDDSITVTVTGGAASKTFYVHIYYR